MKTLFLWILIIIFFFRKQISIPVAPSWRNAQMNFAENDKLGGLPYNFVDFTPRKLEQHLFLHIAQRLSPSPQMKMKAKSQYLGSHWKVMTSSMHVWDFILKEGMGNLKGNFLCIILIFLCLQLVLILLGKFIPF